MRSILAVVEQLDIRRAQVLVEAIIAELSTNNSAQLGVNFAVDGSGSDRPVAYTNLGGATQALVGTIASQGASLSNGLSLALGRFGGDGVNFGFLLSAIASDSDNNILSTPTLVTMDNQEAEIVVGQNVPFVTGTQLSSANDNPFQTIERQDIGISLKVKPQINEGDNIKMEIEQEVSDVSTTSVTGATDITTNKRSIKNNCFWFKTDKRWSWVALLVIRLVILGIKSPFWVIYRCWVACSGIAHPAKVNAISWSSCILLSCAIQLRRTTTAEVSMMTQDRHSLVCLDDGKKH